MPGRRRPTGWHVNRTSLEIIFVVSIPDQARGTDRTAYGGFSLMSSPASRSLCRQYTGPILVNIPARRLVQLRPRYVFCGFQHQPKHDALGRDKTGIIDRPLYNPPISALVSVPDQVWLCGWLPTLQVTIYGNDADQHHRSMSILIPNFTALAYTLGHWQRQPAIDPTPSHVEH